MALPCSGSGSTTHSQLCLRFLTSRVPSALSLNSPPPHTHPPRAALQAAADATVPRLDAATAAQQLRATQDLLQVIAEQQAAQQRLMVVPQDQPGVEVPFSYKEQQQQQPPQQAGGKKVC